MKHPPPALAHIEGALTELETAGLLRTRPAPRPATARVFCSNDYLGLGARRVSGAAGAGAARLVSGDRAEHGELEAAVAEWLGCESALAFSSGYAANVGAISALAGEGDLLVSDALNHASIIDGARLSRARTCIVPHLDVDAVARALESRDAQQARRCWVLTESYFSMDADTPDLKRLRETCDEHRAGLYIDEAHAIAVLGPDGRGLCAEAGVTPDVLVGTLGKALGSSGAFVAGSAVLTSWLWNRARSFVFSTGMSPVVATAGMEAIRIARGDPRLRERALGAAAAIRGGVEALGMRASGWGHVVPCIVGDERRATALAEEVRRQGIWVVAIRPPSVPMGTARLRITASATHTPADVEALLGALSRARALCFT